MVFAPRALRHLLVGLAVALGGYAPHASREASAETASRRAWLGVEAVKAPGGGLVAKRVFNQSPAGKAGLATGDGLVSADGVPLEEPNQLVARIAIVGPNNPLTLKVRRGTTERTVSVMLEAFPGADQVLRLDKVNRFAPAWGTLAPASSGVPASLNAVRGRVVLVDFWATWCGPCRMISPVLSQWQATYGAQGLTVLGLTGEPVGIAAQGALAMGMRYPVASDERQATAQAYGVSSLPTMFLIDKKGVIRDVAIGYDPRHHKELEVLIQKLLAEPGP